MTADHVPVGKKRWLLAIYLDLVIFGALWGLVLHFLAPGRDFTLLRYLMFGVLEAVLLALVRWSPGEYLLSISFPRRPDDPIAPEGVEPLAAGRTPVVDRRVWANEAVLTVALGTLYVVDGSKSIVRWTMWSPPQPFFGVQLGAAGGAMMAVADGILSLFVGALVLRLHRWAPLAVAAASALVVASALSSWPLWDEYVARYVDARRAYQGLVVRPGEVAFMQALTPEGAIVLALLAVIVVVVHRKRFESHVSEGVA